MLTIPTPTIPAGLGLVLHEPGPAHYDHYYPNRPLGGRVSRLNAPSSLCGGGFPYHYVTGQSQVQEARLYTFGTVDIHPPSMRPTSLNISA